MEREVLTFEAGLSAADALEAISGTDPATVARRRQMLYPILDPDDRLAGVITRTQLETAAHVGCADKTVAVLGIGTPVVTHADQTLRTVAHQMADNEIDRMPVVDRDDPGRIVGIISLTMLLAGRLRDLQEARESERVLSLSVVRPRRWWGPDGGRPAAKRVGRRG
jgi:CBS domain-containing protein